MTPFELLDYRRRTAELYAAARDPAVPAEDRCRRFRGEKDALFREHPASPLAPEQRASFRGLAYAPHADRWRTLARVDPDAPDETHEIELGEDGVLRLRRVAYLHFTLAGAPHRLSAYWIAGYGGGLFVPFRDRTSGTCSYGGGRYLLDTIKHADLGSEDGRLVLDFNYAYAPSCAHHQRWVCPLSPAENALPLEVRAGEMDRSDPSSSAPGAEAT